MSSAPTLEDLAARVTQLEQQLASTPTADAISQNFAVINPATGAISAIFPGGVQMAETQGGTPGNVPASGRIEWLNSGAVIQYLLGLAGGSSHSLYAVCNPDVLDNAELVLTAAAGGASGSATVTALAGSTAHPAGASAQVIDDAGQSTFVQLAGGVAKKFLDLGGLAAGGTLTLFDASSHSVFPQLATAAHVRISWGIVALGGGIVSGSGDFTVTRLGVGDYQINFATAFTNVAPAIVAFTVSPNLIGFANTLNTTTAEIVWRTTALANTDAEFCFIAIGTI